MEISYDALVRRTARLIYGLMPERFLADPALRLQPDNLEFPRDGKRISEFHPYRFVTPGFLERSLYFENGIPLKHLSDKRVYTNPLYPAYYGLVCAQVSNASVDAWTTPRRMVDFLLEYAEPHGDALTLPYHIAHPPFDLEAPWTSGLANAIAALLCLELYHLTNQRDYLEHAIKFAYGMFIPVEEGGVFRMKDNIHPWIEEYPGSMPSFVLNGFLFSVIAICSLERSAAVRLPVSGQELLKSVYQNYADYRSGRFLRYSMKDFTMCNAHYRGLHVLLFYQLYLLTGHNEMLLFAKELEPYASWPAYFRSVGQSMSHSDEEWLAAHITN